MNGILWVWGQLGMPQSSDESSAATATDISHYPGCVIHGTWREDLCFMVPSGCHTSGNQKGATPGIGIGPLYLWAMPEP